MFDTLSDRLEGVFKKLKGQGRITERNIEEALREVRLALLEADVNIKVVRDFIEHVKNKALGAEVLRSLTPEQHLIKFVATELQNAMGGTARELDLKVKPPVKIMVVGLQGSGKTTSIAKLARWLKSERKRHPILASTDVYRPAAMEQLARARRAGANPGARQQREAGSDRDRVARDGPSRDRWPRRDTDRYRRPPADRRRADGRAGAPEGRAATRITSYSSPTR